MPDNIYHNNLKGRYMHVKLSRREFIKGAGALGAAVAIDIRFIEKVPEKLLSVFSEETTLKCILVSNLGVMNAGKTTVSMLLTRLLMQQGHTVNNFKIQGTIHDNWVYLLYGGKLLYKVWKYPFAAEYNIFDASTISWIERKALGVLGFYSNADFGIIEGDWADCIYKYWPRMTTVGVLDVEKLPVNSTAVNKVDAVILNKVSHREQMKMPENCIGYVEKAKEGEDPYMLQMPHEIDIDWLIDNAVEVTVPKIELFDVYPTSAEEKLKIGMIGMPGMHFFSEFWDVLEAHNVEIMPVFKREDSEQCDGLMIGYWKHERVDWSDWFDKLKRHILAAIQDGMPVPARYPRRTATSPSPFFRYSWTSLYMGGRSVVILFDGCLNNG